MMIFFSDRIYSATKLLQGFVPAETRGIAEIANHNNVRCLCIHSYQGRQSDCVITHLSRIANVRRPLSLAPNNALSSSRRFDDAALRWLEAISSPMYKPTRHRHARVRQTSRCAVGTVTRSRLRLYCRVARLSNSD